MERGVSFLLLCACYGTVFLYTAGRPGISIAAFASIHCRFVIILASQSGGSIIATIVDFDLALHREISRGIYDISDVVLAIPVIVVFEFFGHVGLGVQHGRCDEAPQVAHNLGALAGVQ